MHLSVPLSCAFGQVWSFEPSVAACSTNTFLHKLQASGYWKSEEVGKKFGLIYLGHH